MKYTTEIKTVTVYVKCEVYFRQAFSAIILAFELSIWGLCSGYRVPATTDSNPGKVFQKFQIVSHTLMV